MIFHSSHYLVVECCMIMIPYIVTLGSQWSFLSFPSFSHVHFLQKTLWKAANVHPTANISSPDHPANPPNDLKWRGGLTWKKPTSNLGEAVNLDSYHCHLNRLTGNSSKIALLHTVSEFHCSINRWWFIGLGMFRVVYYTKNTPMNPIEKDSCWEYRIV